MTNNLTVKYFVQFDYNEIAMSPRIQITKKQYNELREHYKEVVEEANENENVSEAYKSEMTEQDCGNCIIYREWYSVDTATVFLWRYKCKECYHFTTRR